MKIVLIAPLFMFSLLAHASAPKITWMKSNSDSVGLYEKFEISLNLNAEYTNPFDPDQIDLMAVFTAPSGKKWPINGFYEYSHGAAWKLRFSPNELGNWTYSLELKDKNEIQIANF